MQVSPQLAVFLEKIIWIIHAQGFSLSSL
jgi:hypothetical protein